jgi:MFS family permease
MTAAPARTSEANSLKRWGIVIAATFVLAVTAGGRFMVGLVFDDIRAAYHVSHSTLGLIVSVSVLIVGLAQPLVGWMVDRVQARVIAALGLGFIAVGMWITAHGHSMLELILGYGILVAFGLAAVSPVTVTPLVTAWFERRRATALSIVSMGSAFGQLAIVPSLALMVGAIGWRAGYVVIGAALLGVGAPLMFFLLKERKTDGTRGDAHLGCSARSALGQRSFWQLAIGFFVCGFTMNWIMTYFFDYTHANGISRSLAATGLSLMGGLSIVGTVATGWWADRTPGTIPLAVVYLLRGLGFGLILIGPHSPAMLILAMAVIGFSWSSTVPLTSALCADIYGRRSLGTIFGLMFAIMPIGSSVSAALTGYLYDLTGSYEISIVLNLIVGVIAAASVVVVRRDPVYRHTHRTSQTPVLAD